MWVTCYQCNGEEELIDNKCLLCDREYSNIYIWYYYRGMIWIDDNIDPISPPTSPREF